MIISLDLFQELSICFHPFLSEFIWAWKFFFPKLYLPYLLISYFKKESVHYKRDSLFHSLRLSFTRKKVQGGRESSGLTQVNKWFWLNLFSDKCRTLGSWVQLIDFSHGKVSFAIFLKILARKEMLRLLYLHLSSLWLSFCLRCCWGNERISKSWSPWRFLPHMKINVGIQL